MSEYVTIEHYVNHVMDEITKRDVEQVSEKLRALGWEEVVRCRDCESYQPDMYEHFTCEYLHQWAKPDDFCCWGERKQ